MRGQKKKRRKWKVDNFRKAEGSFHLSDLQNGPGLVIPSAVEHSLRAMQPVQSGRSYREAGRCSIFHTNSEEKHKRIAPFFSFLSATVIHPHHVLEPAVSNTRRQEGQALIDAQTDLHILL